LSPRGQPLSWDMTCSAGCKYGDSFAGVRVGDRDGVGVGVEVGVGVGPRISTRGATVVTGMTGIIAITAGRGVTVETAPAPVVNTTGTGGVGAAAESERDAHVLTRGTGTYACCRFGAFVLSSLPPFGLPIAYFRKPKPLCFTCPTKVQ
jgi:hypothetical protein